MCCSSIKLRIVYLFHISLQHIYQVIYCTVMYRVIQTSMIPRVLVIRCTRYTVLFFAFDQGLYFPYTGGALAAEIILVFILAGLEAVRIFLG